MTLSEQARARRRRRRMSILQLAKRLAGKERARRRKQHLRFRRLNADLPYLRWYEPGVES